MRGEDGAGRLVWIEEGEREGEDEESHEQVWRRGSEGVGI